MAQDFTYVAPIYSAISGTTNTQTIGSGGSIVVESGGTVTVASGATLTLASGATFSNAAGGSVASGATQSVAAGGTLSIAAGGAIKFPIVAKTANFTLSAADSGNFFRLDAADLVCTLPAAAAGTAGVTYTFFLPTAGLSTGTGFSISPAAADFICSAGLTAVDNKDLINSGATDTIGDGATIVCDGVDGWYVTSLRGTWAKE